MKKQILSMLLVVAMMISLIPSTILEVFAAPASQPIISVEDVWAASGSTVEVNVAIAGNPGIYGATLTISWAEGLELVDAESGDVFNGLSYQEPSRYVSSGTNFIWYGTRLREIQDGTILKLTFEVAENVEESAVLAINVTGDALTDAEDNTVSASYEGGSVRIVNYLPGDTDENDTIDPRDLVALAKYISDNCTTDPDGFDVTINVSAADVNDDGNLDPRDLVLIAKYISDGCTTDPEGFNVILKPASPKCAHSMQVKDAKAATCTEDGNIAYWYCADCAKYFSDIEAVNEIAYIDTVISATGHTEIVDEAVAPSYTQTGLTEGSHCDVCGEVFVEQEEVPVLQANYHSITYRNLNGAESPTTTQFAEHEGLPVLADISVNGYRFIGWYTEQEGGTRLTAIPVGCTRDMELWARWEIIEYTITYDCGKGTNATSNVATYTVNDLVILSDATLAGYLFNGWTDEDGNTVTRLTQGTTGNILLTANWITNRNLAHPIATLTNPLYEAEMRVQSGDEYSFIYYLGYIENVPFGWTGTPYYHTGLVSYSKEHSTSEATSDSITTTTSKVTEDTRGWQSEVSISSETEIKFPKAVTETITVAASHNQSGSHTTTEENGQAITISQEYVSASTESANITPESSPVGWYRYVNYATIDVFATITYNVVEDKYYVSNFNAVRDITTAWDYSAKSAAFDDETYSDLPFTLPESFFEYIAKLSGESEELGFVTLETGTECRVEGYRGAESNVIIPTYLDGKKVTSINANLFAGNTKITSVTFGRGITSVPDSAFEGCTSLTSVVFEGDLTWIGDNAFKGCTSLEFEIPDTVRRIGSAAFAGCITMDNVLISNPDTSLGSSVFLNCDKLSLTIKCDDLETVQEAAASGATSVYIDWLKDDLGVSANCGLIVPAVDEFIFNGNKQVFYNLFITSNAAITTIEFVTISNSTGVALDLTSDTVNLREMTVNSKRTALILEADFVSLSIGGIVTLTANDGGDGLIANNLTIAPVVGKAATLNINGGAGNSASAGSTGGDGGDALVCSTLTVSNYLTLNLVGGDGGASADYTSIPSDSRNGYDGGKGGNGGVGLSCTTLIVNDNVSLSIIGGTGGNGGKGQAGRNQYWGSKNAGGNGGAGGNGAYAIIITDATISSNAFVEATGGNGGNGGNGGERDTNYSNGTRGSGGSGGSGAVAIANDIVIENITVTNGSNGTDGAIGGSYDSD